MQKSKKLLILGGNGFIGHNAVQHFQSKFEIIVIDRKTIATQLNRNFSSVATHLLDIREKSTLLPLLEELNPHFVLHLASKSTIQECLKDPEGAYLDNVLGNLNVLTSCLHLQKIKNSNFEKLIVHSSDKAYGEHPQENLPYKEGFPYFGGDIYSSSKATQDMMTIAWAKHLGLSACVLRSGNIFGPGDLNITRLVPKTICRLLQNKPPLLFQQSLDAIRDFVFIDDLLEAYDTLFQRGKIGEAYNVGGSGPVLIKHVIEMIKRALKMEHVENTIMSSELSEMSIQYLDSKKLNQLQWNSKNTIQQGIEMTIPFYKELMEKECIEC